MSSQIVRNLDEFHKTVTRTELSDQSMRSFLTADKAFKSTFEASFMIDQENAKQLEKIEKKAQQLREKEKRERNILKKLKKIYEQQVKEFQQLQKVSKQALEQKSREIEILNIENTQLKQEKSEFCTLKDENQQLSLNNQQLESQTKRLFLMIDSLQENYENLKLQFEQQAELLDKGIRQNQIESELPAFAVPGSIQEIEQLSRSLEEQRKNEIESAIKKDEENLKAQTEQINNCNFMLETLLKQIKKSQKQRQQQGEVLEDKIIKSQQKLMNLTDELMNKTQELSRVLGSSHKLQKDLKERQAELSSLQDQLEKLKQLCDSQQAQIQNYKQQIEIFQDSERMRFATESGNKEKTIKNFQKFQEKLQSLISDKKLKQYTSVYDIFTSSVNQIFRAWNLNMTSGANTADKYIETSMKIIENGLISLNDCFRQKSSLDVERVQKMVGFIHNANSLLQKRNQEEDYIEKDEGRDLFSQSTPERFLDKFINQNSHNRQGSESSAKSKKRSILLEQDMENAVVDEDQMDTIRQQKLEEELSNMKNSQIILDSLNVGSPKSETLKDVLSDSSFSKSKKSELSEAEQTKKFNENKKAAILKGKLHKKKAHQP